MRVAANPVLDATEEFFHENPNAGLVLLMQEAPMVNRMDLTVELCTKDMELISLLTGAALQTDGDGLPIGWSRRAAGAVPPKVAVEIWSKNVSPPDPSAAYTRVTWPLAHLDLTDHEYFNGIASTVMTGAAHPNPQYRATGCWNDVPEGISLDPYSPEHMFYDAAVPTLACGFTADPVPCEEA